MIQFFRNWYQRYFSHPQAALLFVFLLVGFAVVLVLGDILAPILAALVIAYLLEGTVKQLESWHLPRQFAVIAVFSLFLGFLLFLLIGIMPILSSQVSLFIKELPVMVNEWQDALLKLPDSYPQFITYEQMSILSTEIGKSIRAGIAEFGQSMLSFSLASIPRLITMLVYLILGPVSVFFFLKDKDNIIAWLLKFMPRERGILTQVWKEMDNQIGNYVRGKFYEIFIVGCVTYVTFSLMGLTFAVLLGVLVGLSVIIPYIGAAVVTLPVALAAYFQMGWSAEFAWLMLAYGILQALDGNLLVPLLFSEAVNLHPLAIIIAVLLFGGIWGLWGVFFAIPLATLVKSLLNVWPRSDTPLPTPTPTPALGSDVSPEVGP